jgi:hypothetical protein
VVIIIVDLDFVDIDLGMQNLMLRKLGDGGLEFHRIYHPVLFVLLCEMLCHAFFLLCLSHDRVHHTLSLHREIVTLAIGMGV